MEVRGRLERLCELAKTCEHSETYEIGAMKHGELSVSLLHCGVCQNTIAHDPAKYERSQRYATDANGNLHAIYQRKKG